MHRCPYCTYEAEYRGVLGKHVSWDHREEVIADISKFHKEGYSYRQIAPLVGLSSLTTGRLVRDSGEFPCPYCEGKIPNRILRGMHIRKYHRDKLVRDVMKLSVEGGMSYTRTARELCVSRPTIQLVVREIIEKNEGREEVIQMFKCHYCPQKFATTRGRGTHLGRRHSEEFHSDVLELYNQRIIPKAIAKRLSCSHTSVQNLITASVRASSTEPGTNKSTPEPDTVKSISELDDIGRILLKLNPAERELIRSKFAGDRNLGQEVITACIDLNSRALLAEANVRILSKDLAAAESKVAYLNTVLAKREEFDLDEKAKAALAAASEGSLTGKD